MVPLALMESAHFHLITSAASRAGFAHRFGKCRSDRFAIICGTALRNLGWGSTMLLPLRLLRSGC